MGKGIQFMVCKLKGSFKLGDKGQGYFILDRVMFSLIAIDLNYRVQRSHHSIDEFDVFGS